MADVLPKRAIAGGMWFVGGSILTQAIRFGRNIVLTRLLTPESFGVMSIILSVSFMVEAVTEIGIKEAVIQCPKGSCRDYVNSAWWLAFGRSVLIYGTAFTLAPSLARFYHNPGLMPLMRIALLSIVCNGAMSPNAYVALKNMHYKRWALLQYGSGALGTLLTVCLTYSLRNVWALAMGFVVEYSLRCLMSYALCPFFPTIALKREPTRELLSFSRGMVGLSALNFVFLRSDVFVLGKMVAPVELGIYTISIYLAQVPASFTTELLGQTLMPLYANMRSDFPEVNRVLSRITHVVLGLCLPAVVVYVVAGRVLLATLYGRNYSTGFWPLGVALIVAFANIANSQITTVLYAVGRPHAHRLCVGAMALVMGIALYPSIQLCGTVGAQISALIAMLIGYGIQLRQINKLTGFQLFGKSRRVADRIAQLQH